MSVVGDCFRIGKDAQAALDADARPWMRWTEGQTEFGLIDAPEALLRGANQIGKSEELAKWVVDFCEGRLPWSTHRPPVTVAVLGVSREQMYPLHERIWRYLPKRHIRCLGFEPGLGIRGKPPRVLFSSGPGEGSLILFGTYSQNTQVLAGKTLNAIVGDEPMPERVYGEITPRLFRTGGYLRVGFTPTPDSPPVDYLRKKVEAGTLPQVLIHLNEKACWPIGDAAPWKTQDEIDAYEERLLPIERPMRMRGDWEPVLTGNWLRHFGSEHEQPIAMHSIAGWRLGGMFDYGIVPGKMAFVLGAFKDGGTQHRKAAFLEELAYEDAPPPSRVAADVLGLLARRGLRYRDVDFWVGDRSARGRSQQQGVKFGNREMRRALADLMGRPLDDVASIYRARKGQGSVVDGMRRFHEMTHPDSHTKGVPHFRVDADRCPVLAKSCRRFKGSPSDPLKDVMDCARYGQSQADYQGRGAYSVHY